MSEFNKSGIISIFAALAVFITINSMGCTPAPIVPIEPNLESIQEYVFTPSCVASGCHGGDEPLHGWDLRDGSAYDTLVYQRAASEPDFYLVDPGNPDNSLLIKKLEGTAITPSMPFLLPKLEQYKVDAVREWISNLPVEVQPDPGAPQSTQAWLQTNVFDISCAYSGCHDPITAEANLDLSASNLLAETVGVLSTQKPSLNLIEPGDADNSYFIHKLESTNMAFFTVSMPWLFPVLSEAKITAIRDWIDNMAP